jgi:hypothetical protein
MDKKSWLNEHLHLYEKFPEETVLKLIDDLQATVSQYLTNRDSKAALGLLELASEMTECFLKQIDHGSNR